MEWKEKWVKQALRQATKRAKKTRLRINITEKYLSILWDRCNGACALTGIVFHETSESLHKRRPYIPSLDRINSNKGYIKGNVRFVCVIVNMALFTWGDEDFDRIVRKRIEFLNKTKQELKTKTKKFPSNGYIFAENPEEQGLITRGRAQTLFGLCNAWFFSRIKQGLAVPCHDSVIKKGMHVCGYCYDKAKLKKWFVENPETKLWKPNSV